MGNLLAGKAVGIVGFGRIGRKVAEMLRQFGVQVCYHDLLPVEGPRGCLPLELNDLLARADIVTLHVSGGAGPGALIGKEEIAHMKEGSWLVNVSRGGVVDETALLHALMSGHLHGAALDVFAREPYDGPLKDVENVILTPHVGSYAVEGRVAMEVQAAENLIAGLSLLEPGRNGKYTE